MVQMAYEWVQRMGDMRTLKWDNIDLEAKRCDLEQSKRRASVTLPISDNLCEMLKEQHDDFGFQEYVAPVVKPQDGVYLPYTKQKLSKVGRKIIRTANLPDNLWLMDLRRTGTTQMNEAGVSMGQIMATTGHANPQSVKPYMNHTFAASTAALETRNVYIKKG
jgi:integrase